MARCGLLRKLSLTATWYSQGRRCRSPTPAELRTSQSSRRLPDGVYVCTYYRTLCILHAYPVCMCFFYCGAYGGPRSWSLVPAGDLRGLPTVSSGYQKAAAGLNRICTTGWGKGICSLGLSAWPDGVTQALCPGNLKTLGIWQVRRCIPPATVGEQTQ
ncbi:hypothetical protein F5Y15DRAFT_359016 [Xylariaceae sp. FL0016]|nr:hypothetical protein F5Y15DRAFT_359016 [Xylariaceae sp. FL0016]